MRHVHLYRAEGDPTPGVNEEAIIVIVAEIPTHDGWTAREWRAFFAAEAAALADALWLGLPGGTFDLLPTALRARRQAGER